MVGASAARTRFLLRRDLPKGDLLGARKLMRDANSRISSKRLIPDFLLAVFNGVKLIHSG